MISAKDIWEYLAESINDTKKNHIVLETKKSYKKCYSNEEMKTYEYALKTSKSNNEVKYFWLTLPQHSLSKRSYTMHKNYI